MRNLLTGLDVGTSKVCAIVGESLPDGQLATLGFGISPCTGLRKGVVVNIEATVDAIKAAVEEAEKTSGVRVGSVVVGVAGRISRASTVTGSSQCAEVKSACAMLNE